MTVTESKTIDAIGIERSTDEVVLTIADHLGWTNAGDHLSSLQAKLNRYVAFIESGDLIVEYPNAKGRKRRIDVVFQHEPTDGGLRFLATAQDTLRAEGIKLAWSVLDEGGRAR